MKTPCPTPFILVDTHCRGAGIALVSTDCLFSDRWQHSNALIDLNLVTTHSLLNYDTIESIKPLPDIFLYRSLGQTAENLAFLFSYVLKESGFSPDQISSYVFCHGPGSFTGLRMGCAFLNGLILGKEHKLFSIRCPSLPSDTESDPTNRFVDFYDLWNGLQELTLSQQTQIYQFFEPAYGREPGPVLKLKGLSP